MRLINCEVTNFGSYSHLEFDFADPGLYLVYGKTGSGKSTIADIACWILYGITAKAGSVDDIRSWQSPDETTRGDLKLEVGDGTTITVVRMRGKAGHNDLYWLEQDSDVESRGKDLLDTQKLLEKRLGVSGELYLTSAYFHEFSDTGSFFVAKAKDRRAVFERIASMELAVKLGSAASEQRKIAKSDLSTAKEKYSKLEGKLEQLIYSLASTQDYLDGWKGKQEAKVQELLTCAKNFDKTKASKVAALETRFSAFEDIRNRDIDELVHRIEKIDQAKTLAADFDVTIANLQDKSRCPECNGLKEEIQAKLQNVLDRKNRALMAAERRAEFISKLEDAQTKDNPYTDQIENAKREQNQFQVLAVEEGQKSNPFIAQLEKTKYDIVHMQTEAKAASLAVSQLEHRVSSLSYLYDLSYTLRGELLKKAVKEIEASTNRYLEKYFDGEMRVGFNLEGSDDLQVSIQKSGFDCVYKQLSKGQRGLLKLCFVVSVMNAAANKAGAHFQNLFFDEALDGLDSDLKVKAFGLFQELENEHDSIVLIEHAPEFHQLFGKRYHVSMTNDESKVVLENE